MKILYLEDSNDIEELLMQLNTLQGDPYASDYALEFDYVLFPLINLIQKDISTFGNLSVDFKARCVYKYGNPISLTRREYDLLTYLIKNSPRIVSKDMILTCVWKDYGNIMSNTVEVHLNRLRKKIGREYIECVKGFGYKFVYNTTV